MYDIRAGCVVRHLTYIPSLNISIIFLIKIMVDRYRQIPVPYYGKYENDPSWILQNNQGAASSYMKDDPSAYRGEKLCINVKAINYYNGPLWRTSRNQRFLVQGFAGAAQMYSIYDIYARNSLIPSIYVPLQFQVDNNFNIINLLYELDDTLAVFSKQFWKSLSYGAVSWSLLPLVSDLKSLAASLDSLINGKIKSELDQLAYGKKYGKKFGHYYNGQVLFAGKSVKLKLSGDIRMRFDISLSDSLPPLTPLYILLDELGAHPDINTLWDVIPLSFIVDYFVPVGDILQRLHPSGWFTPELKTRGSFSFKGKISTEFPATGTNTSLTGLGLKGHVYHRQPMTNIKVIGMKEVNWQEPNIKQYFDTAYVFGLFKKFLK